MTWMAVVVFLLMLGALLLAIELLVIPGFGLIGVLGLLALAAGVTVAWLKVGPAYGALSIGAGIAASAFMFWLLPRTGLGKGMILQEQQKARAADASLEELMGREGTALTPLRPSGTIDVGGRAVDVVTDGIYVESGVRVRVARVEGSRVLVEPV
jgi:membrane-bound ClpP family serine protease